MKIIHFWKIEEERKRREKIKERIKFILFLILWILLMIWGGFTFPY